MCDMQKSKEIAGVPAPAEDRSPLIKLYKKYTADGPKCQVKCGFQVSFCSFIRILKLGQEGSFCMRKTAGISSTT